MRSSDKLDLEKIRFGIDRGVKYLLSMNIDGRWKGFQTLAGESDIWATGFVLTHIQNLVQPLDKIVASHNFLLESRHYSGGWSYSGHVPPDADSTSWCLMALKSSPYLSYEAIMESRSFLWSNFIEKGIATYGNGSGIREFISATTDELLVGWISAHPDVSAAATLADSEGIKVPEIISWLSEIKSEKGFIKSYWWRNPFYATVLLLRTLLKKKKQLNEEWGNKMLRSLVTEQQVEGGYGIDSSSQMDPFVTALALEMFTHLSTFGETESRNKCAKALLNSQQENGSWEGGFNMRIPAPFVINPEEVDSYNNQDIGGNSLVMDQGGLFATTMSCYALQYYMESSGIMK